MEEGHHRSARRTPGRSMSACAPCCGFSICSVWRHGRVGKQAYLLSARSSASVWLRKRRTRGFLWIDQILFAKECSADVKQSYNRALTALFAYERMQTRQGGAKSHASHLGTTSSTHAIIVLTPTSDGALLKAMLKSLLDSRRSHKFDSNPDRLLDEERSKQGFAMKEELDQYVEVSTEVNPLTPSERSTPENKCNVGLQESNDSITKTCEYIQQEEGFYFSIR